MDRGWIKIHRKILESSVFWNPRTLKVFLWCLMRANHAKQKILFNGEEIIIEAGSFIFGRDGASTELKIHPSSVYRHIKLLEKLRILNNKSNNKFSVINIVNWEKYQGNTIASEQPVNNQRTTSEQPANTDKNDKNVKNDKNNIYSPEFELFWNVYPRKESKVKANRCWLICIKNGVIPQQLITCAANYAKVVASKEKQYIKMPATFLGVDRHYEDYLNGTPYTDNKHQNQPRVAGIHNPITGEVIKQTIKERFREVYGDGIVSGTNGGGNGSNKQGFTAEEQGTKDC